MRKWWLPVCCTLTVKCHHFNHLLICYQQILSIWIHLKFVVWLSQKLEQWNQGEIKYNILLWLDYCQKKSFLSLRTFMVSVCPFGATDNMILTLSQKTNFRKRQILDFKTERVCRQQFQIWWKWKTVIQTIGKQGGKRKNCLLQAISTFPTVFSKDLCCRHVKNGACLGKA